jgi:hypothetical protein
MYTLLESQPATPQSTKLYTNLYEVLQILQDEMVTTDDSAIVATVLYLLQSGRLQFLRPLPNDSVDDLRVD